MAYLLHRVIPAVLLAATATLGGNALGESATACAAPADEWDIGKYDMCIAGQEWMKGAGYTQAEINEGKRRCCNASGGVWNEAKQDCQAPPAQPAQQPGVAPNPSEATQNPAVPPPIRIPQDEITATFQPAPVG